MKEDLVDYDGKTRLFKGRTAHNLGVALSQVEYAYYQAALDMVDSFFLRPRNRWPGWSTESGPRRRCTPWPRHCGDARRTWVR